MRRTAAAILLALAVAACRRAAPPPPPPPPSTATAAPVQSITAGNSADIDADNLLNLAYGATVVSRTGESNLEYSAVQAIDGLSNTFWSSPPGGARQTLVFALATRTRLERLGTSGFVATLPGKIRFDVSLDGKHWREASVQTPPASNDPQIADITPVEARYVRVETVEPATGYSYFRSVHAIGTELARPATRKFDGCWVINGEPARFTQNGARVTGVIASDPPTFVDGGTDGRVAMLMWTRGPNFGYAIVSMDPDTRAISGLTMYDEVSTQNAAAAWFGKPCATALQASIPNPQSSIRNRWSMYGLAFDAKEQLDEERSRSTLDELTATLRGAPPAARFRIAAHELRRDHPNERTAARIASIRAALQKRGIDLSRIELVAAGDKWTGPVILSAIQRVMCSSVDLERAP